MKDKNDFYVYKWYNLDTKEVFYIGKGHRDRYKSLSHRNQYFLNYVKNNQVFSEIIQSGLTEEEAFMLEEKITNYYKSLGQCQCCLAKGGTGGRSSVWTDEFRKYWSEYNPMKEERQRQRMRNNNPMKNPDVAKKSGLKSRRAVYINGVFYNGVIEAATVIGVCGNTISSWCKRGYNTWGEPCHYADEKQKEYVLPSRGKGVIIDNEKYYPTIKAAALALGSNDSSLLGKALKQNKLYKGHRCEYANQQPS